MELRTRAEGNALVMSITGKLDAVTAPKCEQKIREVIEGGTRRIVVDLEQLDYISSAGLRVLLLMSRLLKEKGGKACLANVGSYVRSVFEMSGFTVVLGMEDSVAAAVKALP
jgi:stage II sporulation protein AA (anti-sigma F factor antagonist)